MILILVFGYEVKVDFLNYFQPLIVVLSCYCSHLEQGQLLIGDLSSDCCQAVICSARQCSCQAVIRQSQGSHKAVISSVLAWYVVSACCLEASGSELLNFTITEYFLPQVLKINLLPRIKRNISISKHIQTNQDIY